MFVEGSITYSVSNFHRRARIGLILVRGPRDFPLYSPNDFSKELNMAIILILESWLVYLSIESQLMIYMHMVTHYSARAYCYYIFH